ncbi:MAG TPA: hypothetical protein VFW94_06005, partial [Candidatus Acidoferrales bacterium]|nr:hypothetical protein [Candidatus Acidoferrales bacterium]
MARYSACLLIPRYRAAVIRFSVAATVSHAATRSATMRSPTSNPPSYPQHCGYGGTSSTDTFRSHSYQAARITNSLALTTGRTWR